MTDDDLELEILKRFVAQHAEADRVDPERGNKCLRELDMRAVLSAVTGKTGAELEHDVRVWFARLVPHPRQGTGPLRPCKKQFDHKYHARAFLGASADAPAPAWDRIRELERSGARARTASTMTNRIKLFISHSSTDTHLAGLLIGLLRAALNLPAPAIRCTSVDGYKLQGGADTDEQLRQEVHEVEAFVGIVSRRSLRSPYVLFELGARWGANKHLMPVLSPGTEPSILGGPIAGLNARRTDSAAELHQMVTDLGHVLNIVPDPPASYEEHIARILDLTPVNGSAPATSSSGRRSVSRKSPPTTNDLVSSIPEEARELLMEASQDARGEVLVLTTEQGLSISANGREFIDERNARTEARWRRAVETLQGMDLLEKLSGNGPVLSVTKQGFEVADLLAEEMERNDPHLGSN